MRKGRTFQVFARKLFGAKCGRLKKVIPVYLIVYAGLCSAGVQIQIAPFIFWLMTGTFTAGVMWRALSSDGNAADMQNMLMLPIDSREFVFSYAAALGAYTILTKTAVLFCVLLAVSDWNAAEIAGGLLSAGCGVTVTAAVYSMQKSRYGKSGVVWAAVLAASVFFLRDTFWGYAVQAGSIALALRILYSADGFSFFHQGKERRRPLRMHRTHSVLRYFFRYLWFHKNYLVNTGIMWGAACVLPLLFRQAGGSFMVPVGFAVLSLNTPLCILLSCDPALEQAVRFLPGQRKAFCVPYVLFLFLCNLAADSIFLISWQLQAGNISAGMAAAGLGFAFLSAVLSVLLEWFFPIRRWKIESDLWHHPRKYLVPGVMLLLAGILAF